MTKKRILFTHLAMIGKTLSFIYGPTVSATNIGHHTLPFQEDIIFSSSPGIHFNNTESSCSNVQVCKQSHVHAHMYASDGDKNC